LDKTIPSVTISSTGGLVSGDYILEVTITDANLKSSLIEYQIGSETAQTLIHISGDTYGATINTTTLDDGTHTIKIIAYDHAGNVNDTQTIQINVDNTKPSPPTISDLPSKTEKKEITLTGIAEPGSEIEVFLNGVSVGNTTADDDGKWSLDVTLEEGENKITVESRDAAGNLVSSEDYSISLSKEAAEETDMKLYILPIVIAIIVVILILFLFLRKKPETLPSEEEIEEEKAPEEGTEEEIEPEDEGVEDEPINGSEEGLGEEEASEESDEDVKEE